MFKPTFNAADEKGCTFRCTNSTQLSPNTVISPAQQPRILLITHDPIVEALPVAPNVAGSSPVSHPNFSLSAKNLVHLILLKRAICRQQSHFFNERLGDEHAVKRVPVMHGQSASAQGVLVGDTE
jgi:hypothetical protein